MPQSVLAGKTVEAFFQRIEALGLRSHDHLYTGNQGMPDEAQRFGTVRY